MRNTVLLFIWRILVDAANDRTVRATAYKLSRIATKQLIRVATEFSRSKYSRYHQKKHFGL